MRKEESTNVDKKIYTRVKHVQETINNQLAEKLGVSLDKVKFSYEDITTGGCCPQMKVTAYVDIKRKKSTETDI